MSRLAFLLIALAAFTACRRAPSHIDPVLEAFVPEDAVLLAGVRVEPLRGTPLFEKVMAIAPVQDARELLLASDGRTSVLAARGTFAAGHPGLTVVDAATALAGAPEAVRAALARRGGKPAVTPLLTRARAIPAEYQVWAVSSGTPDIPGGAGNFDRLLRAVADVTFVADLRSGIRAEARGVCRDEPNARKLADALRGLLALARLAAPKSDPALNGVYDAIRIEQQRDTVRLKAEIPAGSAARLLDLLGRALNTSPLQ